MTSELSPAASQQWGTHWPRGTEHTPHQGRCQGSQSSRCQPRPCFPPTKSPESTSYAGAGGRALGCRDGGPLSSLLGWTLDILELKF